MSLISEKNTSLKTLFSNLPDCKNIDQEVSNLDAETLKRMLKSFDPFDSQINHYLPFFDTHDSGNRARQRLGQQAIQNQKVGCIILAGGQGTRLGHPGPKGTFPVTPLNGKSLFQLFSEKIFTLQQLLDVKLPLAIMTSDENDQKTRQHFAEHRYFGLDPNQVHFFTQTTLPFLDSNYKLFRSGVDHLAKGPDGNGGVFEAFQSSKIAPLWEKQGIEYFNVIQVDNPLADPFDFELIGTLIESSSEVCLKSCKRLHRDEKVGVIFEKDNRPVVIEYHEIPKNFTFKEEPCANLSMFAMTHSFLKRAAKLRLPLHKAKKKATFYDSRNQVSILPEEPNAWKFERYWFDVLPHSNQTAVVVYPREEIFYPLKNKEGPFSIKEVHKALQSHEAKIFEKLTQRRAPAQIFELSAEFYYPTDDFIQKVRDPNYSLADLL